MKIKSLKEHPLLNPPPGEVEGWRRITSEDQQAIRERLGEYRRVKSGRDIAMMHYLMKELDLPVKITPEDERVMRMHLKPRGEPGYKTLFFMRNLGLDVEATPHHREDMYAKLEERRRIKEGDGLAEILYYMNGLGLGVTITPEDEKIMVDTLGEYRNRDSGGSILRMLYYMKALDMPQPMTPKDKRAIRRQLEETRHREGKGDAIAWMHHMMGDKLPPAEQQTPPIPPIKKFTKR